MSKVKITKKSVICNSLHKWHFENLNLKQIINLLIENEYNFELKVDNEKTSIIIYNIFEVHYFNNELDWIKSHEN